MAKKIKTPQQAADKYVTNTANAQAGWQAGADIADWQGPASSQQAESNYAQGVQAAVTKKSRQTAIAATPNSVYKAGIDANPQRYSSGTAAAKNKVLTTMSTLLQDIDAARQALPPRGPRGSAVNMGPRLTGVQNALIKNRGKYKARGIAKVSGSA
ncbi:MAG: hypothetical protein KGI08_07490 [Thaumarchaeota archaeon]|nr:hypothetical protein [Nitrososphaerota archaeon]